MLWHHTAEFCPQGDIGRFTDQQIATAVGWTGDPYRLVGVLVGVALVDRCCTAHRLVVHGWVDHADDYTLKKLKRKNLEIVVSGHSPDMSGQFPPACARTMPMPEPTPKECDVSPEFDDQWQQFKRLYDEIGEPLIEADFRKAHLIWRVLDFGQRTTAIVNLAARKAVHEARFIPRPEKYLQDGEYSRAVIAREVNGKRDLTAIMLEEERAKRG